MSAEPRANLADQMDVWADEDEERRREGASVGSREEVMMQRRLVEALLVSYCGLGPEERDEDAIRAYGMALLAVASWMERPSTVRVEEVNMVFIKFKPVFPDTPVPRLVAARLGQSPATLCEATEHEIAFFAAVYNSWFVLHQREERLNHGVQALIHARAEQHLGRPHRAGWRALKKTDPPFERARDELSALVFDTPGDDGRCDAFLIVTRTRFMGPHALHPQMHGIRLHDAAWQREAVDGAFMLVMPDGSGVSRVFVDLARYDAGLAGSLAALANSNARCTYDGATVLMRALRSPEALLEAVGCDEGAFERLARNMAAALDDDDQRCTVARRCEDMVRHYQRRPRDHAYPGAMSERRWTALQLVWRAAAACIRDAKKRRAHAVPDDGDEEFPIEYPRAADE